jgi:hypothetical protein
VGAPKAWAQGTAGQTPAASEESPEYKQAIGQALEEYGLQHYEESRTLFERAHSLDPNARTLRGLGMVEFELRHYVAAEGYLEASLKSTKKALTEEQRAAVTDLLARTKQFIAKYELAVEPEAPAGMRVELDGKPVQWDSQEPLSVEAGEHVLRVSAPNADSREVHLDVKGGEQQTLRIELTVRGPQEAVQAPKPVQGPVRPYKKLGIALTAAGGFVAIAGGVLGVMALSKADDAVTRNDSDADSARTMALVSDVGLGVGVATAVAGIVLLVWKEKPEAQATASRTPSSRVRLESTGSNFKVSF